MLFQRHHESNSKIKNFFYKTIGFPHVGSRIRGSSVFKLMTFKKGSVVLDLGSGSGLFSLEMRKRGYTAISSDLLQGINFKQIKKVRKIFEKDGYPLHFVLADAQRLPFKDGSFDGVLIADVIEHIPNENAVMKEMFRILKENGMFIASTPCTGFHSGKFKPFFRWLYEKTFLGKWGIWNEAHLYPERMMKEKGHRREYSLEKWQELCRNHNFALEAWDYEYKFFGAFFVELSHAFKIFEKYNIFFPIFYPIALLDKFIPIKGTGIAIRAKKVYPCTI